MCATLLPFAHDHPPSIAIIPQIPPTDQTIPEIGGPKVFQDPPSLDLRSRFLPPIQKVWLGPKKSLGKPLRRNGIHARKSVALQGFWRFDAMERRPFSHGRLRHAVAWSYDLLDDAEKVL